MSIERARTLRKSMSPAEARMWTLLRNERFRVFHFRRQVPIGPYFADFASHRAKLVIEVDGDTHYQGDRPAYDATRDAFLRSQGFDVARVTNLDVLHNLDGVAHEIYSRLEVSPTPAHSRRPSPQGGGREEHRQRQGER